MEHVPPNLCSCAVQNIKTLFRYMPPCFCLIVFECSDQSPLSVYFQLQRPFIPFFLISTVQQFLPNLMLILSFYFVVSLNNFPGLANICSNSWASCSVTPFLSLKAKGIHSFLVSSGSSNTFSDLVFTVCFFFAF